MKHGGCAAWLDHEYQPVVISDRDIMTGVILMLIIWLAIVT